MAEPQKRCRADLQACQPYDLTWNLAQPIEIQWLNYVSVQSRGQKRSNDDQGQHACAESTKHV
jgi:hypothetical protein